MSIKVANICKNYGNFNLLKGINFEIQKGELVALLGPSGSGKTTLLRIIAGLDCPTSGEVYTSGINVINQSARERKFGFVFQNYALFNHMNIYDNIAFGLKILSKKQRPSNDYIKNKVIDLLELMRLESFADRFPLQLSGGQRQRVALARALAIKPEILLLDEPFGALDAKVRKELRSWMRRLHNDMHITSIFVTHDQEEAMEVADKVIILNNGIIEQIGSPAEVYNQPSNSFVYDFLGDFNVFDGWRDENNLDHITDYEVIGKNVSQLKYQPHWLIRNIADSLLLKKLLPTKYLGNSLPNNKINKILPNKGIAIQIFARPHEMEVTKNPANHEYIIAKVLHINQAGSLVKIELERKNGSFIYADITKQEFETINPKNGDVLYIRPKVTMVFE
jgi:sulfate transport system ATP-binding protein